jgi:hypothetical protein
MRSTLIAVLALAALAGGWAITRTIEGATVPAVAAAVGSEKPSTEQNCRQHYDTKTGQIYYGCEPSRQPKPPTPAPARGD